MRTRFYPRMCAALWLMALVTAAQAGAVWHVSAPYAGNPLQQAQLDGRGSVAGARFPVGLQLECRADAPQLGLHLSVPASIAGRDLSVFEGPQGVGQRRRLLVVSLAGDRLDSPYLSSGFWGTDGRFVLAWNPDRAFIRQLPAGRALRLGLLPARRGEPTLWARFDLPADNRVMLAALAPCLAEGR